MINKIKNNKFNQGQIAIIVLLASAVLLTLGLSASRKTITDTKIDTDEQLLKEAFNTAESGINNYLNNQEINYSDSSGNSAIISTQSLGGGTSLVSDGIVTANTPQLFWLVDHDDQGNISTTHYPPASTLRISVDSTFQAALKIDYYYKNGTTYSVNRSGFNFHPINSTVNGYSSIPTNKYTEITTINDSLLIVITPIGAPTRLTLSGSHSFPNQGEDITAVGTAGNGVKTQIKTRNTYQIPSFFLEAITAGKEIK